VVCELSVATDRGSSEVATPPLPQPDAIINITTQANAINCGFIVVLHTQRMARPYLSIPRLLRIPQPSNTSTLDASTPESSSRIATPIR